MREKTEEWLTELKSYPNGMSKIVRGLKIDSKYVECRRCMRGSVGLLCFNEKERSNVWNYMERFLNGENDWVCQVKEDTTVVSWDCIGRDEVVQALKEMKSGEALDFQIFHWS